MAGHGGAAVELLPYSECSAGHPGSIPTMGSACTEFGSSPRDLHGFSPRSSVSSHTPKTVQVCGLIGLVNVKIAPSGFNMGIMCGDHWSARTRWTEGPVSLN